MATSLRSANVSLLFDYESESLGSVNLLNQLWQTLRRTAVEPGQASSPDFLSFADECLFCAQITTNAPTPTEDAGKNNDTDSAIVPSPSSTWRPLPTPPSESPSLNIPEDRRVGLIYLHAGPANFPAGEANIGVIMKPSMQRRGYAREAVHLVLGWAFEELKFHRVQAAILDTPFRDRALRLFIGSGFVHEGTKRRAVYQPEGEGLVGLWQDATYLAMLDTEWMLQSTWKRNNQNQQRPVISVWDEMFARHAREREELLKWEEKHERMTRSPSTETLRESARKAQQDLAYLTDDASSFGEPSQSGSSPPSPGPNIVVTLDEDSDMEDGPGIDQIRQQWGMVPWQLGQGMDDASLQPPPLDRVLSLPSIPSTRLSDGDPQSPVTILSSSPGSSPPSSPSLSPVASVRSPWTDSEDEDNWLPDQVHPPSTSPIQPAVPYDPYPYPYIRPASVRSRSRNNSGSSSSSSDTWSDAQSSIGADSSTWDVISNSSDHSRT